MLYVATVLPALGNDPIAGGDEGWIISSSAKLAREGVFGSNLFYGFYGVEDHYFFNLPLHHLILAGAFEVGGVSLTTGRLVSVAFGLAALLLTFALGRRIGGAWMALGAAAMLVLLRLNLAPFSGLTLTDLGATVRYDLITLPFSIGAVLLLLRRPDDPAVSHVAFAGLLTGLGALTQFIGAFIAPPLALFLLLAPVALKRRLGLVAIFGAMALLPFLPYFAYIGSAWEDFQGQARAVDQRTDFASPSFYLDQLRDEPDRYASATSLESTPEGVSGLIERPSARLVMLFIGPAALIYALWRGRSDRARLLVGLLIASLVVEIALFESTKRFVYWVVVVPYLCVAIADLGVAAWNRVASTNATPSPKGTENLTTRSKQLVLKVAVVAVAALFLIEGMAVAGRDIRNAGKAPDYEALGRAIDEVVPARAVVIGDNRLWPAIQDRELRSLLLLFYETNPRISEGRATSISGVFDRIGAEYIMLSPLSRDILTGLSPQDDAAFRAYLGANGELVSTIEFPTYGPIEVYRLRR